LGPEFWTIRASSNDLLGGIVGKRLTYRRTNALAA
jgi:hypothetical protein